MRILYFMFPVCFREFAWEVGNKKGRLFFAICDEDLKRYTQKNLVF